MLGVLKDPAFWQVYLPSWLQAIGTLGAVFIAWRAFSVWGKQERASRRAEFAETLLRRTSEVFHAARNARPHKWLAGPRITPQVIGREVTSERLESCRVMDVKAEELRAMRIMAGRLLDQAVADELNAFLKLVDLVKGAYEMVSAFRDSEVLGDFAEDDQWRQAMKAMMKVMGFRFYEDGHRRAEEPDDYEISLRDQWAKIENAVEPHLSYATAKRQ